MENLMEIEFCLGLIRWFCLDKPISLRNIQHISVQIFQIDALCLHWNIYTIYIKMLERNKWTRKWSKTETITNFFFVHSLECINSRKLKIYFQEKWFCSIRSCVAAAKCEFIDILSFLFGIFFCWTITIHCQKLRKYGESFFITIEARNWNDSKNRHSMHNKNRTHSCFSVLYYFYVVSCGNANKIRFANDKCFWNFGSV